MTALAAAARHLWGSTSCVSAHHTFTADQKQSGYSHLFEEVLQQNEQCNPQQAVILLACQWLRSVVLGSPWQRCLRTAHLLGGSSLVLFGELAAGMGLSCGDATNGCHIASLPGQHVLPLLLLLCYLCPLLLLLFLQSKPLLKDM